MDNIKNFLPNGFQYVVISSKIVNQKNFNFKIRSKINTSEEWDNFFRQFTKINNVSYITKLGNRTTNENSRFSFSKDYVCAHSNQRKIENSKKDKSCSAKMSIRIKKDTRNVRYRDEFVKNGFLAVIDCNFEHTHKIYNAEAFNWLKRDKNIESIFTNYFIEGKSPSEAMMYHESIVFADGDVEDGICSCHVGMQGAFCKHQAAVHIKFQKSFPNMPLITLEEKMQFLKIALGENGVTENFISSIELDPVTEKEDNGVTSNTIEHNIEMNTNNNQTDVQTVTNTSNTEIPKSIYINSEKTLESIKETFNHMYSILEKEKTNENLMMWGQKFASKCKRNITTGQDIGTIFQSFISNMKTNNRSKRIKVQPTSMSRRKKDIRRGSSFVHIAGRRKEFTKIQKMKRKRCLAYNIDRNQPNSIKHNN